VIQTFVYVEKVDESTKVTIRDYLGYLTDQLEEFGYGSFRDHFVSGSPKNYGFSVIFLSTGKRTTKCKGHNFELCKFKTCKLYIFEKHDFGRRATCTCSQSQEDQEDTWRHSSVRSGNQRVQGRFQKESAYGQL